MIRLSKRIQALEAINPQRTKLFKAYQSGVISLKEYHFAIENEGMNLPPISWLDHEGNESENSTARTYRRIMQKIGLYPNYTWQC